MYRKGFEVFFVEMSTAVFVPNKRAIRIALHYGNVTIKMFQPAIGRG